jgi:hypothetical protein
MLFWYLLYFSLLTLTMLEIFCFKKFENVNSLSVLIVFVLTLVSALRGDFGVDTKGYIEYFEKIPSLYDYFFYGHAFIKLEPLYQLTISLFKVFFNNYNLFQGAQTFFLLLIVIFALRKLHAPVNLGLFIYFSLFYYGHFEQQRMAIVYVLIFLASTYIVQNNFKKFFVTVVLASGFHYMAVLYLPAFFLKKIFISKKVNQSLKSISTLFLKIKANFLSCKFLMFFLVFFGISVISVLYFDFFGLVYNFLVESLPQFADNIYYHKFVRYYERIDPNINIANALFGLSMYFFVIFFMFSIRKIWLNNITLNAFVLFVSGYILIIYLYPFPWLSYRTGRMFMISGLILIFSFMIASKKKFYLTLPFFVVFTFYQYYKYVNNIGGYIFLF